MADDASALASAYVKIQGDMSKLSSDLDSVKSMLGGHINGIATMIKVGIGAAFAAALAMGTSSLVEAAISQEDAEARLNAVLRAKRGELGYTLEELKAYATQIQNTTRYEDDAALSAMSLLAAMRNIRGENFMGAMEAAQDLAAFMGEDLTSAAAKIAKALEDPEAGFMALRKAMIMFTDDEKDRIKGMLEGGQIEDAQRMILERIKQSVGGMAGEMANTTGGAFDKMKNQVGDLKEAFGRLLIPAIRPVVDEIAAIARELQGVEGIAEGTAQSIGKSIGGWIRDMDVPGKIREVMDFMQTLTANGENTWKIMQTAGELAWESIKVAALKALNEILKKIREVANDAALGLPQQLSNLDQLKEHKRLNAKLDNEKIQYQGWLDAQVAKGEMTPETAAKRKAESEARIKAIYAEINALTKGGIIGRGEVVAVDEKRLKDLKEQLKVQWEQNEAIKAQKENQDALVAGANAAIAGAARGPAGALREAQQAIAQQNKEMLALGIAGIAGAVVGGGAKPAEERFGSHAFQGFHDAIQQSLKKDPGLDVAKQQLEVQKRMEAGIQAVAGAVEGMGGPGPVVWGA